MAAIASGLHDQLDPVGHKVGDRRQDGTTIAIGVDAFDHENRPPWCDFEPQRVRGIGDSGGHPRALPDVVVNPKVRERLGHRARRRIDLRRAREAIRREPGRPRADRHAIRVPQPLQSNDVRAWSQLQALGNLCVGGLDRAGDEPAAHLAAAGADNLGKAGALADRIRQALRFDVSAAAALGPQKPSLRERRDGAPHGVTVHPESLRQLDLARKLRARLKSPDRDRALELIGGAPPQRHAGLDVRCGARAQEASALAGDAHLIAITCCMMFRSSKLHDRAL